MYTNRIVSDFWSFLRQVSYRIVSDSSGLGIVSDGIVSDLFEYRIVSDFWYRLFFANRIVSYRIITFFSFYLFDSFYQQTPYARSLVC